MYSDENNISGNKFIDNLEYGGYFLVASDNNLFTNNVFINNTYALRIKGSMNSTVTQNVFMDNQQGLYLCCGAKNNRVYGNIFYNNSEWSAFDVEDNYWDNNSIGNFWDTFYLESQGAYDNNTDGIVDSSYDIPDVNNDDHYPLAKPPIISNPFYRNEDIDT